MGVQAVYAIRNKATDRMYIGSAVDHAKRFSKHKNDLKKGRHHSQILQRSYDKHGSETFEFSILEYIDDRTDLLPREQVWLNFFKPHYNIAKFAGSPTRGLKFSAETRAKMSAAGLGRKRPPRSDEWKEKLAATKRGKPWSDKAKKNLRFKKAVLFSDPEYRMRWAEARSGKIVSVETRAKISAAAMGNTRAKGFKYHPSAYDSRRKRRVS